MYSRRLLGGGDNHCTLSSVTFENVRTAIDAFTQEPDPSDSLYQRTLSERRADGLDELALLRSTIRRADAHQRRRAVRRTRPCSGVTVNAHINLRTLAGTRDITDLDDLVLRGEGWNLNRSAAEQMLCDSSLVVTLFDGKTQVRRQ